MADAAEQAEFTAPGWGTWRLDLAHFSRPYGRLFQSLYPDGMSKGLREGFDLFGLPIRSMTLAFVHGWAYARMAPLTLGLAGEQVPTDELMADIGRLDRNATEAIEKKVWRSVLERWDRELKPASIATHVRLARVGLNNLSAGELADHVAECVEHYKAMVYQHHRSNSTAMFPLGEFCMKASEWTGKSVGELLRLFEGASPVSGVWCDEIAGAARAVASDFEARDRLGAAAASGADPGEVLAELRARSPEVDEWAASVGCRIVDGFDLTAPTLLEMPALMVGKLAAAVDHLEAGTPGGGSGSVMDELEGEIRALVDEPDRASFDDMLREARAVYRFRDERGLYSDIAAAGLLRLAALELGRRLVAGRRLDEPEHLFDATGDELVALVRSASAPDAAELRSRAKSRREAARLTPPAVLGDPPTPPQSPSWAPPPAVARVSAGTWFMSSLMGGQPTEQDAGVVRGVGITGAVGPHEGRARVVLDPADLLTLEPGDVLIAPTTTEAFNSAIHLVGAIVTDHGGVTSHAAIVAREVGIPAVVGTTVATARIPDGATVVVDGTEGTVTVR